jgi:hypothetical protein
VGEGAGDFALGFAFRIVDADDGRRVILKMKASS